MKKVAITGGLSSGKSTVCRFLKDLGAYVVSADEIAHRLLSFDPRVKEKVVNLLGTDVLTHDQLNRQAIAKKVFSQPTQLESLENILHPLLFHEIESEYQAIKNAPNYNLFVAEIPLLYETKNEALFDAVVSVLAKEDLCQKRFNNLREKEGFAARMLRQIPPEEKAKKADFVVLNNGHLEDLQEEVKKLAEQLRSI